MFDMGKIGHRIAQLRKERNMTQMELADRLNISFQAVSNWERGQSMPDIAKLGELSSALDTTIDELLENERGAYILKSFSQGTPPEEPIKAEELVQIAPILKPQQIDHAVSEIKGRVDLSEIIPLMPFLSDQMLDEIAWDCYHQNGLTKEMVPLAPFISDETMNDLVKAALKDGANLSDIDSFFPFIEDDALRLYADSLLEKTGRLDSILSVVPFLEDDYINALAVKTAKEHGLCAIVNLAPFVDDETLNDLARITLEKDGLSGLSPIMPFIDESVVEDYLRRKKPHIK